MIKLRESDIAFIKKYVGEDSKLLYIDDIREFLIEFGNWLDVTPICWNSVFDDYSDIGREAQRVYDYAYEMND